MPSVTKRSTARGVKYRAEAALEHKRGGKREYKTFSTKAEAMAWALQREAQGKDGVVPGRNVRSLLEKYSDEVSEGKAGKKWEQLRLALICRMAIADVELHLLKPADVAKWRDDRLKQVGASSVRREMNLIGHALSIAAKEWGWLKTNPISDVKRPESSPPRDRVYSAKEIERINHVCGDSVQTVTGRVGLAFRFALETAMRAGEIVDLTWDRVHLDARYIKVDKGKTVSAKRDVPLSNAAAAILGLLDQKTATVFDITSAQLDALFRKASDKALVVDATFHDCRHTAATALSKKLDVLALAKMMGIKDLRLLISVYYNPKATDLAKLLD
jgi:integrase